MAASKKKSPPPALLEWAAATLGLILTLAVLAVVLAEALAPRTAPDIAVRQVSVAPAAAGWRVEIEARNRGRLTAADVVVEGRLGDETAQVVITYVPGGGTERAALTFAADPRGGNLQLAARGWTEP